MAEPLPTSSAAPPRSRADVWLKSAAEPEGLTSVELSPEDVNPPAPVNCPKCQWRLIDPETLGYCPKCGYCRYVEDVRRIAHAEPPKPPSTIAIAFATVAHAIAEMPGWFSIMLIGSFTVMLYCKILAPLLADGSYEQAIVGLSMILAGLLTSFLCQLWALFKVAPQQQELTFGDVVLRPGLIWQTAVRELPATRWPIWIAAWGIALALGAAIFIGGQAYWIPDAPPPGPGWWE